VSYARKCTTCICMPQSHPEHYSCRPFQPPTPPAALLPLSACSRLPDHPKSPTDVPIALPSLTRHTQPHPHPHAHLPPRFTDWLQSVCLPILSYQPAAHCAGTNAALLCLHHLHPCLARTCVAPHILSGGDVQPRGRWVARGWRGWRRWPCVAHAMGAGGGLPRPAGMPCAPAWVPPQQAPPLRDHIREPAHRPPSPPPALPCLRGLPWPCWGPTCCNRP
jgi:hypothetical protein